MSSWRRVSLTDLREENHQNHQNYCQLCVPWNWFIWKEVLPHEFHHFRRHLLRDDLELDTLLLKLIVWVWGNRFWLHNNLNCLLSNEVSEMFCSRLKKYVDVIYLFVCVLNIHLTWLILSGILICLIMIWDIVNQFYIGIIMGFSKTTEHSVGYDTYANSHSHASNNQYHTLFPLRPADHS